MRVTFCVRFPDACGRSLKLRCNATVERQEQTLQISNKTASQLIVRHYHADDMVMAETPADESR